MFDGPDNWVKNKFELVRGKTEEGRKTMSIDSLQQAKKQGTMLRKLLQILVDHLQRALEDGI